MAAPFMYELLQLLDMRQSELAGEEVYDAAVQQLLDRMLESPNITLQQKQQGLKAAARFVSSPSVLRAAGNKLVEMRLDQFGDGDAGPSSPQGTPCSQSTSLTDSCKHGHKASSDGTDSTSMEEPDVASESDTDSAGEEAEEAEPQEMEQLWPEEKQYDDEAAPILAAVAAAVAAAPAAAGQQQPALDQAVAAAAAGQQQPALDQAASAAAAGASDGGEEDVADMEDSEQLSDLDTDDTADEEVAAADAAALKEIRHFQKATHRLTSRAAFSRIVQDVLQKQGVAEYGVEGAAVDALQRASESFVSDVCDAANCCAVHAGRQKVTVQDMHLAMHLTDKWRYLPRNG